MTNPVNIPTSAFNVERARAQMMEGLRIPDDLLQSAIDKIREKVNAKKTLFFTHRGEVVETAQVDDNGTQIAACDKIFDIAGVKARERDATPSAPSVAMEIDPKTGIVRLVIGQAVVTNARPSLVAHTNDDASIFPTPVGEVVVSDPAHALAQPEVGAPPQQEFEPQVVKVPQGAYGNLPSAVRNALFGDG